MKRKQDYQDYLASNEWQEKRLEVLERDDFTCQHCGIEATEVHHLTYARIFHEALDDLVSLCRDCHAEIHDHDEPSDDELFDEAMAREDRHDEGR
jgi:5-methylcytosine-specific restriction endonuclease McrA